MKIKEAERLPNGNAYYYLALSHVPYRWHYVALFSVLALGFFGAALFYFAPYAVSGFIALGFAIWVFWAEKQNQRLKQLQRDEWTLAAQEYLLKIYPDGVEAGKDRALEAYRITRYFSMKDPTHFELLEAMSPEQRTALANGLEKARF